MVRHTGRSHSCLAARAARGGALGILLLVLGACSDSTAPSSRPMHLAFTAQPSNTNAGAIIAPAVEVAVQDADGSVVTDFAGAVTVALGAPAGGAMLAGTKTKAAVHGVATFADLRIDVAGTAYTLTATSGAFLEAVSAPFTVAPGPSLEHLVFIVQPSNAVAGAIIAPAVKVAVQDAGGHTVTAFTGDVTITIGANPASGTLTGTATAQAVAGVASFSDLSIDNAGSGYSLKATSSGLTVATSAPFTIAPVPSSLHITTATTGAAIPNAYALSIDCYSGSYSYGCFWSGTIGANSAVTVPVAAGSHSVELDGVPANCGLSGTNPRAVTVSGTTGVPFSIACLDTGSVRVSVTTTGTDLDQNGYNVCVSRATNDCVWTIHLLANDVATIGGVTAEPHQVTIRDVVDNCSVSGDTTQALTVPAHGTTAVAFAIGCVLAERIAYSSSGAITVARVDGVSGSVPVTHGFSPAWSADGARLAYQCGPDICAISPDGSGFAQLTTNAASNRHPTWSPDGAKIAFSAATSGVPDLWVMAVDGSGAVRLTENAGFVGSPAWSPDGTKIAFDCQVDPANDDICVVNADGTGLVRLTNDPARDYGAAWKPDGSTLAFATTRFGADEIVLMSATGGSVTRIGPSLRGSEPSWSPDGSQLAFVGLDASLSPDAIKIAHTDGSNVVTIAFGDEPAWRPHR